MSKNSSIWTNPLTLILIFLAFAWIFAIAKFCATPSEVGTPGATTGPQSPVPDYVLLQENNCPLKLPAATDTLAAALLRQYFRLENLNQQQEAVWRPDPELDPSFSRQFEENWETYVECIQTLQVDSSGTAEKLALIVSNFPDNDCRTCAPYVGYIRFIANGEDPATIVIRDSKRALFKFGAYGAIGDQISLVNLGRTQALLFSTAYNQNGLTMDSTVLYSIDEFRPLLKVKRFESNGGIDTPDQYETRGELYLQAEIDPYLPAKLALYEYTSVPNSLEKNAPDPTITYFQYDPEALKYVRVGKKE